MVLSGRFWTSSPFAALAGTGLLLAAFVAGCGVGDASVAADSPITTVAPAARADRDFMFQVLGVKTANQGGHTLNLFFRYRYEQGIAESDIPDYTAMRRQALEELAGVDATKNPYWETVNHAICTRLYEGYPLQGISCQMQVDGVENPAAGEPPGYRSSVETIGDVPALAIPGPPAP